MQYIYVMTCGSEWEDVVIYLTKEEAIHVSIQYPTIPIEIFAKNPDLTGYRPTYNYYRDGIMYDSNGNILVAE